MIGRLALVLHAHLPFVRHPECETFLEEQWLFEAITETYLPLLQVLEAWQREGFNPHLSLTLSPTLCAMLGDPLLSARYRGYLEGRLELAQKEVQRTRWLPEFNPLARFYLERFQSLQRTYEQYKGELVGAFSRFQQAGLVEILACAATHALLPLLAEHPTSIRAQLQVGCDCYRRLFGRAPRGLWLPECAYAPELEPLLQETGLRWFILETHGVLHARPRPRSAAYAPLITPGGLAAFGRDPHSARQVWSREEGYPGDPRYRDFYRDIGFDLDSEYLRPYQPAPGHRSFSGIKYHRISGGSGDKAPYQRGPALEAAAEHARHFLDCRIEQLRRLEAVLDEPPLLTAPYDAELFGHWWFEGPEFLDALVRQSAAHPEQLALCTPEEYLQAFPTHQAAAPAASSWGEQGHWRVWLNDTNAWIYPHLQVAQERMSRLADGFAAPTPLQERALRQAGRELLLAQASDWPFMLRAGTCPEYARRRVEGHVLNFTALYEQLTRGRVEEAALRGLEEKDNLFPELEWRWWKTEA